MAIEEHRHCTKCGKVIYLKRGGKGGHFPELCDDCSPEEWE